MENQNLEIKVAIQIQKPRNKVFEAIINPEEMKHYFISKSTGRMIDKAKLVWKFSEFDVDCPIRVGKIEFENFISFYWDINGKEHFVEMFLTSGKDNANIVTITEKCSNQKDFEMNWLKGKTEGWANFLACLKAYLEYGVNLRKGAFDFRAI